MEQPGAKARAARGRQLSLLVPAEPGADPLPGQTTHPAWANTKSPLGRSDLLWFLLPLSFLPSWSPRQKIPSPATRKMGSN